MDYIIIILVLMVFGLGLYIFKLRNEKIEALGEVKRTQAEMEEYEDLGRGLAEYNQKIKDKKQEKKSKILEMFENSQKLSNHDIADKLNISRVNTVRYLDELESEGSVKQVGRAGRAVFYEKNK